MPNSLLTHPLYLQAEELFQNKQNKKCLALLMQIKKQKNLPLLLQQRIANRLFIIYTRLGNLKLSEKHVAQSLELAQRLKNRQLIYSAYDNMAAVYMQLSEPLQAIVCLQKSLRLKEKAGNTRDISNSLLQLSGLHFKIENIVDGKKTLEQAGNIIKRYKQTHHYPHLHFTRGMLLKREKKYPAAVKEYDLAVRYSIQQKDHLFTCRSLYNQAIVYIESKQWKSAHKNLLEELKLVKRHGIKIDELTVYIELARVSIALKKTDDCFTYIQKVKQLSKGNINPMVQQTLHDVSAQYYEAVKQYDKAVPHYKAYIDYHTNSYNQELSSKVTQLQARFQAEKRERELKEAQLQRTQTELNLLRAQLNPHFMFNALNGIRQTLLEGNSQQAEQLITRFAKLVRLILNTSRQATMSLTENLELLQLYVGIEQFRQNYRFSYSVQIAKDIHPSSIKINGLLLQPLIENAIVHGLFYKTTGKGTLSLQITKQQNVLTAVVTDNGIGRKKAEQYRK